MRQLLPNQCRELVGGLQFRVYQQRTAEDGPPRVVTAEDRDGTEDKSLIYQSSQKFKGQCVCLSSRASSRCAPAA